MRTILLSVFSAALLLTIYSFGAGSAAQGHTGRLEITVDYDRQAGRGSNQYAVWIEDSEGNLVRTLYLTRFTGEGGYNLRPDCTPRWVTKAGSPTKEEADAYTGATPQTGTHTYIWDGTDDAGKEAASGDYRFIVEATYLGSNIVVFEDVFTLGGQETTLTPTADFNSGEQQNRGTIKAVTARYIP